MPENVDPELIAALCMFEVSDLIIGYVFQHFLKRERYIFTG